jgi:hypothetical protein
MSYLTSENIFGVALLISVFVFQNFSFLSFAAIMAVIGIAHKYGDFIYRSYLTLGRDLWGLYLLLAVKYELNRCMRRNRGLHEMFVDVVRANKNKTAIIDIATGETLTFAELNALSNKFANYFQVMPREMWLPFLWRTVPYLLPLGWVLPKLA